MRNLHSAREASGEGMVSDSLVLEYTELFVAEPVPGNAVAVEDAGVRCEAR
jgi:hypothetical protein